MGTVIWLGDSDDLKVVGRLGTFLTKTKRAGFQVADGFIIPKGKHVGFGMSNEIQRNFDKLGCQEAIVRSSPISAQSSEAIFPVSRANLISTIGYIQRNSDRRWEPSAILVQQYLDGEFCGRIHSHNPYTNDHNEVLVEASLWANNSILGGDNEPEMILINKKDGSISLESNEDELLLSVKQINQLYRAVRRMEEQLGTPVSLDWGFVGGVLYILNTKILSL